MEGRSRVAGWKAGGLSSVMCSSPRRVIHTSLITGSRQDIQAFITSIHHNHFINLNSCTTTSTKRERQTEERSRESLVNEILQRQREEMPREHTVEVEVEGGRGGRLVENRQ
ncbi:hypothetical protein EYF80_032385 [Liparis tanakae]|uniref:Uncharacterized protein n=1 Tax=Liparis tanakae TaxID=230148 RepID=A0A4Z2GV70_9TELE|nr:hypothetical protein EYF80_032385 [Liparis tanakae]